MFHSETAPNRRSFRTSRTALALLTAGLSLLASDCNNQYIAAGTCNDPQVLEGDSVQITAAINSVADFQFHCGSLSTSQHPSRVFQWKPASSGSALITLAGSAGHTNLDTVLDVIGSDCMTEIMCDDDCNGPNSCLTINVVAGRTYTIAAGTFATLPTAVSVDLAMQVTPAAPDDGGTATTDGDASSAAACLVPSQVLSGNNVSSVGMVTANTTYQFHCGATTRMQPSYAFQWTPQSSGTAQISLTGDGTSGTVLDVGGSDCSSLACNANLPSSRIAMNVTAGQVYNIVAGTLLPIQSPTAVTLSILVTPNTYLDGGVISGGNACVTQATQMLTGTVVNSVGAISSTSLFRFHCVAQSTPQPSYTFQWRAPASGIAQVSLYEDQGTGSVLDVVGQDCNSEVACNAAPAPLASNITMNVIAGQIYNLVVGTLGATNTASTLPNAYLNIELMPTPTPDASTGADASVSMMDAAVDAGPPPLCTGALTFACPQTMDCTAGNGGALTYQVSCAAEQGSIPNVCGQEVISGNGQPVAVPLDPTRQCLPALITCYGPDTSSWQCPTRWAISTDAGTTRQSACCYWDISGTVPQGACGVPAAGVAAACVAPPAGAQPE